MKVPLFLRHPLILNGFSLTCFNILNSAIPFLLLPFLTRFLTPFDYGMVATIMVGCGVLSTLLTLGAEGVISVNFFRMPTGDFHRSLFSVVALSLAMFLGSLLLLILFPTYCESLFKIPRGWLVFTLIYCLAGVVYSYAMTLFIVEERVMLRNILLIMNTLFNALLSILTVWAGFGWQGRVFAIYLATILVSVYALYKGLWPRLRGETTIGWDYMKDAIKFGLPMIVYGLSGQIMLGIDRFFLSYMVGVEETGVYTVGYQVGMLVSYVTSSFNTIWSPFLFKKLQASDGNIREKRKIVKFTYAYCFAIMVFSIAFAHWSPSLLRVLVGRDFQGASKFIGWISLGYGFQGIYMVVSGYVFFLKRTMLITGISCVTACLNIFLTYVLIQRNGAIGAAQATCFTYAVFCGLAWVASARLYPMPWNIFKHADDERKS